MATKQAAYHVVCHDCREESLVHCASDAEAVVDEHKTEHDHRMAYARVD